MFHLFHGNDLLLLTSRTIVFPKVVLLHFRLPFFKFVLNTLFVF